MLFLTHYQYLDEDDAELIPMFGGENYEDKYDVYKAKEEEDDEVFWGSIDKLSSIATIWYMSGVQQQEDFDNLLEEISDEAMLDDPEDTIQGTVEDVEQG